MLTSYLAKKLLDSLYDRAKSILKESGSSLLATRTDIEESLNQHLRYVRNWSSEISFTDLKKAKDTTDVFIDLNLYIYPRRVRIEPDEKIPSVPLRSIFEDGVGHVVLLGQPGAGKTTSLKHLCQCLFLDDHFPSDRFSFPLLIKFRDLTAGNITSDSSILLAQLADILGLRVQFPANLQTFETAHERTSIKNKLLIEMLEEMNTLVILDGFDEFAQLEHRETLIREISYLAAHLNDSSMIVTSRTGDFLYSVPNTAQYEISPLTKQQVSEFALKWLSDEKKAATFLTQVYDSPFADTTIRPLTLAHLCAIFERIGRIPDKPKTVYRKIVNLLLEEWDQQRSVKRVSRYGQFEVDRKFEFLCNLAYVLTTEMRKTSFAEDHLLRAYDKIYVDCELVKGEANQVVRELETHTGLVVQSGYDEYEFAHKSLQEYLSAEYLVKLPSIPSEQEVLSTLANELALAISISSNATDYFSELLLTRLTKVVLTKEFTKAFLSRLLLEKPQFNSSFKIALGLIQLYSSNIEDYVTRQEYSLLAADELIVEFERVMKFLLPANSMAIIRSNYDIAETYEVEYGGDEVLLIKRKRLSDVYVSDGLLVKLAPKYPKMLYVRRSILDWTQQDVNR
jgi:hypothetical protein